MILYILRHGIAEDRVKGRPDTERALTDEGRARTLRVAKGLRNLGIRYDALLTSPLIRAVQTAAIVSEVFEDRAVPEKLDALSVGVAPANSVAALKPFLRMDEVIVVGHEPGLSELAATLLTGSVRGLSFVLKKAGCIALEIGSFGSRGSAQLLWMMTPGQLRLIGK
jgi:phosphohistidine phosphatase